MQGLGWEMDSGRRTDISEEGLQVVRAGLPVEISNPDGERASRGFRENLRRCRCFRFFLAFSSGPLGSVREDDSWTRTS